MIDKKQKIVVIIVVIIILSAGLSFTLLINKSEDAFAQSIVLRGSDFPSLQNVRDSEYISPYKGENVSSATTVFIRGNFNSSVQLSIASCIVVLETVKAALERLNDIHSYNNQVECLNVSVGEKGYLYMDRLNCTCTVAFVLNRIFCIIQVWSWTVWENEPINIDTSWLAEWTTIVGMHQVEKIESHLVT